MGWWKIKDVKSGQIDECFNGTSGTLNAIHGEDTDVLVNGDEVSDIIGSAIQKINEAYKCNWGRSATPEELQAAFNFVLNPQKNLLANANLIAGEDSEGKSALRENNHA